MSKKIATQSTSKNPNRLRVPPKISILDLPPEILMEILKYLNYREMLNTAVLCKSFYYLHKNNNSILSRCIFNLHSSQLDNYVQGIESKRFFPNIRIINLRPESIENIFSTNYGSAIKRLYLKSISYSNFNDFLGLLKKLPNLEFLELHNVQLSPTNSYLKYTYETEELPKIRSLSFRNESFLSFQLLRHIIKNVDVMLHINLHKRQYVVSTKTIYETLNPNLQDLVLNIGSFDFDQNILFKCNKLEKLGLIGFNGFAMPSFTSDKYIEAGGDPGKLKYLDLTKSDNVTTDVLVQFTKCFNKLKTLNISSCNNNLMSNSIIINALQYLEDLETLKANACFHLNNQFIFDGILKNKNLNIKELDLGQMIVLSEDSVLNITKQFPNLTNLNLSHCRGVTNVSLKFILNNLKLKSLDLTGCKDIAREWFIDFDKITKKDIFLLQKQKMLTELKLGSTNLCDNFFKEQFNQNMELKKLFINELQITVNSLKLITKNCPMLEELNIQECSNITKKECAKILTSGSMNNIKVLHICPCNNPVSFIPYIPRLRIVKIDYHTCIINAKNCKRKRTK